MTLGRRLAAVGVLAASVFAFQAAHSPFLRIEAEAELAACLAREAGLETVDVMALRELVGVGMARTDLERVVLRFSADRQAFASDALAALAAAGHRRLAERLFATAEGSAPAAEALLWPLPEAISAVRFEQVRRRFAARR